MLDPRIKTLSYNLINYSCRLKKGENVLIEVFGDHYEMASQLVNEAYAADANPFVHMRNSNVMRALLKGANKQNLEIMADVDFQLMQKMDAYIGIRGGANSAELSDVPADKMEQYMSIYGKKVHWGARIPDTKWVVLRYPSASMAQMANMSTETFEDYYFDVCCLDYSKMGKAMQSLTSLMDKTDKVHIKGPGTDLTFSIKGIASVACAGTINIPDGEVFTAPVKDSINGTLSYNTPALYQGVTYENISFEFKDGKIIKADSNLPEAINKVLDTDEGARYIGEFAFGVNPFITKPMKDILFDEKIAGSIHLTPGNCYDEADNGNNSAIHWDLILIQTPEYGGGEIYFDDVLIRKDGLFVLDELKCLNSENLK
ncbi:MAG: aminopeptidase [Clostridiales bacterium]|nr:aminopeptidase [Clostridiales bacterium]